LGKWFVSYNRQDHIMRVQDPRKSDRIHKVYMCTYDQDRAIAEGGEYDFILWDEPPPEDLYEANQIRLVDRGGWEAAAFTPAEDMIRWPVEWIHFLAFDGVPKNGIETFGGSTTENMANLDPEAFERTYGKMSDAEKEIRLHGKFSFRRGLIYKDPPFDRDLHVCEPFDVMDRVRRGVGSIHRGLDHGIGNPTAVSWWYITGHGEDTKNYKFAEYLEADNAIHTNCKNILRMESRMGLPPGVFRADPSIWHREEVTGKQKAVEYKKHGLRLVPGPNELDRGHNVVQNLMRIPRNAAG
ncbi:MAG: hypothetical protein GY851_05140, partial [bacterium]|nr:hypothetical protein [bacterium]